MTSPRVRSKSQPGLFDALPSDAGPQFRAELSQQAAWLRRRDVHLGTSSWSFAGWAGVVYPPGLDPDLLARDGLHYYARHPLLDAVGVDRTYYGALTAGQYRDYARQVPAGFRFIAKADRAITTPPPQLPAGSRTIERFFDSDWLLRTGVAPMLDGLAERAGGLILQFPPLRGGLRHRPEAFAARLRDLLAPLPRELCYFVEVRNRELLTPDYFAALADTGAEHCYTVHPGAPPLAEQWRLSGGRINRALLIRWNLQRDRVYTQAREEFAPFDRIVVADPDTRMAAAELVVDAFAAGKTVYVLANNKAEGCAPRTIELLAAEICRRR